MKGQEVLLMKDIIAKLMLISIVVMAISVFIYDHQLNNIKEVDARAITYLNSTNLPYEP